MVAPKGAEVLQSKILLNAKVKAPPAKTALFIFEVKRRKQPQHKQQTIQTLTNFNELTI